MGERADGDVPTDAAPSTAAERARRAAARSNDFVNARISQLLSSPHPATGTVLYGKDVSARASERGQSLSASYILGLRGGKRPTPSLFVMQLLADIYDVDLSFFTTTRSLDDIRAERQVQASLNDADAVMMLRAASLTTPAKKKLAAIIEDMLQDDTGDS